MKICITCDSLEEFQQLLRKAETHPAPVLVDDPAAAAGDSDAAERHRDPVQNAPQQPAAGDPGPGTGKPEKPVLEAAAPAAGDAKAPAVTEDFRMEVRHQLATLNRKVGRNRAAELIQEQTGANIRLTEVALSDLPKIMEAVKAELADEEAGNAN